MKIINRELPNYFNELKLLIMADTHIGDGLFNEKKLKQMIKEIKEEDNTYVIINGDLLNNGVKHSKTDIYSEQHTPGESIEILEDLLEPIKDKILVMLDGNHENRTYRESGLSIMKQVARTIGKPELYADPAFLLYLSFGKNRGRDNRKTVYAIYGKHGNGGASKKYTKMKYVTEMSNTVPDADVFVHSHTHLPGAIRDAIDKVDYRNRVVRRHERIFVNSSAFLKFGGYGERKNYPPSTNIYPHIYLDGKKRLARALI